LPNVNELKKVMFINHAKEGNYMRQEVLLIGIGNIGNMAAIELTRFQSKIRKEISRQEQTEIPWILKIHSAFSPDVIYESWKDALVIIVGSVQDHLWEEARVEIDARHPYLTWSIGARSEIPSVSFSCLLFSNEIFSTVDLTLTDTKEVALMILLFLIINTGWEINPLGSVIAYSLACTKDILSGQILNFIKIESDRKHYRQAFSALLEERRAEIHKAKGVLLSVWCKNDMLSLHQVSELINEIKKMVNSETKWGVTYHILPEDKPDFMATFFIGS
jgi:hypothetical protein